MGKADLEYSIKNYVKFHKKYTNDLYEKIKDNQVYLNDEDIKVLLYSYDPVLRFVEYCVNKLNLNIELDFESKFAKLEEEYKLLTKKYEDTKRILSKYQEDAHKYIEVLEKYRQLSKEYENAQRNLENAKNNLDIIQKKYKIMEPIEQENRDTEGIESLEEIKEIVENNESLSPGSNYSNSEMYREYLSDSPTQWD